jgi:hypothetical protein
MTKKVVFWIVVPCSLVEVFINVSEVLAASIIRATTAIFVLTALRTSNPMQMTVFWDATLCSLE